MTAAYKRRTVSWRQSLRLAPAPLCAVSDAVVELG